MRQTLLDTALQQQHHRWQRGHASEWTCSLCCWSKPAVGFSNNQRSKPGRSRICVECQSLPGRELLRLHGLRSERNLARQRAGIQRAARDRDAAAAHLQRFSYEDPGGSLAHGASEVAQQAPTRNHVASAAPRVPGLRRGLASHAIDLGAVETPPDSALVVGCRAGEVADESALHVGPGKRAWLGRFLLDIRQAARDLDAACADLHRAGGDGPDGALACMPGASAPMPVPVPPAHSHP